ncbi:MAG: DUF1361 domain-containing protein [Chloroflexota bacterium]
MIDSLLRFNRFFERQSLYPILLSSVLALSMYVVRVVYYESAWVIYANLVWNLVLAWVPYLFSLLAAALHTLFPRRGWLLVFPGLIWLAFFPNAPYILTDFLHLTVRADVPIWYDNLLLVSFSWTGIFLAMASLRTMQSLVKAHLGGLVSWFFVAITLGLTGLGIYLGRFERWNSWDLVFHHEKILADIARRFADPLDNLHFFGFTLFFIAFLAVCYLMFISVGRTEEPAAPRTHPIRRKV